MDAEQLERLIALARETDDPPEYVCKDAVQVRGDPLTNPIYWTGRQWAVTELGIEARDGTYPIEKARIWEGEESYGWVKHMINKGWVDLPDFAEALRIARKRWPLKEI